MYIRTLLVAILATLLFTQPSFAKEEKCYASTYNDKSHLIVFVNGIMNFQDEACDSLQSLRNAVDVEATQSDFSLFYNSSQKGVTGFAKDIAELRLQASISDRAIDIAQNDLTIKIDGKSERYNYVLGKLYSDKLQLGVYKSEIEKEIYVRVDTLYSYLKEQVGQGKLVTVVAHSQGNNLIEAAIAIMRYRGEADIANKIHVVGVAPVSSTTPNGVYFSLKEDEALDWQRRQTAGLKFFKVLPSNASGGIEATASAQSTSPFALGSMDGNVHSFEKIYLNQFVMVDDVSISDRIRDQVYRSRDGMEFGWEAKSDMVVGSVVPSEIGILSRKASFDAKWPNTSKYGISVLLQTGFMSGLSIDKYEWDFGDGKKKTELLDGSTNHYFPKAGTYRVTLWAYHESGSVYRCTKIIEVDPKVDFYLIQREEQPCA